MVEFVKREANPGPQSVFLSTTADIAIYGGFPGGGKSYGLMLEACRHFKNPNFRCLIIRRIREDITKIGGLWQASKDFFAPFKTKTNDSDLKHTFPAGGELGFGSMRDARKDHERYKSAEIDLLMFEEIAGEDGNGIEEHQFWYMLSRNRGKARSGIKSYVRGTSNPAPGWLARMLLAAGYIGPDGYAIPEMSGVIRWFYRDENTNLLCWFDTEAEAKADIESKGLEDIEPMSFTFILAKPTDNPYQDENYLSKLSNLGRVERERLKKGNWLIEADDTGLFKRHWWGRAIRKPAQFKQLVRAWDIAATEKNPKNDPAYTASVLMGITAENYLWILHAERFRESPAGVRKRIRARADQDAAMWGRVVTTLPMDPGAAGKLQYTTIAGDLRGHLVKPMPTMGDKTTKAEGLADSAENGFVMVYMDPNSTDDTIEALINEGATFPYGKFKDLIDAAADAHDYLTERRRKRSAFDTFARTT